MSQRIRDMCKQVQDMCKQVQRNLDSDLRKKMAMVTSAQDVCHQLLNHLRLSNLNFLVSETPFSAQIFLRKRFVKEATGPSWPQQSPIFPTSHKNLNQVEQVQ